jgi:urease accessory protein
MRGPRPFVMTNMRAGDGVDAVTAFIEKQGGLTG